MNNEVFLDQKRFDKMCTEIPKILCLTRSALMEKFKISGSVARAMIRHLVNAGEIKPVGDVSCASFSLYTGKLAKSALEKKAEDEAAAAAKQKK